MEAQTLTRKPNLGEPGQPQPVRSEAAPSPLETKVLELVGRGVSNGDIARILWITELSVVSLVASIRAKRAPVDGVDAFRCVRSVAHA